MELLGSCGLFDRAIHFPPEDLPKAHRKRKQEIYLNIELLLIPVLVKNVFNTPIPGKNAPWESGHLLFEPLLSPVSTPGVDNVGDFY